MVEKFRKTKMELIDKLYDDIEKLLNEGFKHKEIHEMICESGVKMSFVTFKSYLYKIHQEREKERILKESLNDRLLNDILKHCQSI